ncbi:MAG: hypothetical protein AAF639_32040 [Chloroflexota bacterium]
MPEQAAGGWTTFSCDISKEALEVFKSVQLPFGKTYTPVAVATQVVSGTNYDFFCNTKVAGQGKFNEIAMVSIYEPVSGEPEVTVKHLEH